MPILIVLSLEVVPHLSWHANFILYVNAMFYPYLYMTSHFLSLDTLILPHFSLEVIPHTLLTLTLFLIFTLCFIPILHDFSLFLSGHAGYLFVLF